MENNLAVAHKADELLTQEQMAERLNKSVSVVCERLKALHLLPVRPANRTNGIAALYNYDAYLNLEEEEEETKLRLRHEIAVKKEANALSPEAKVVAVRTSLEDLIGNIKGNSEAAKQVSGIAFMMIQALAEANSEIAQENEQLKMKLDIANGTFTCETFAVRELGHSITTKQARSITRLLHMEGRDHVCKAVITGSTYPACVWTLKDMEYAQEKGWFNDYV